MKKKLFIAAAALGISMTAAGCAGQASNETTTTTSATAETTSDATTSAATESATATADTTASTSAAAKEITESEAKNIALKAAGFAEADVTFKKVSQDLDDVIKKFEIEFIKDGKEYSYDINMATGEIISQEIDNAND